MARQSHTLLLVEDNPDDVFIMRYALEKAGLDLPLFVAEDGQDAVDYIEGTGRYSDRAQFPLPTVIFLDLKLPRLDGFEFLAWLRQQPGFDQIEVIILTSSGEDRDQKRARELGVRHYLVKPPRAEMLRRTLDPLLQERFNPA
ncbi:MAG TPA: response regulator [Verrucomicrobiae bacterium]|nr:response regulator [Verrucomicrobiae bacterium]